MIKTNKINYDAYVVMLCQASQELLNRADKIARYAQIMNPLYEMAREGRLGEHTYELTQTERVLTGYTLDFSIPIIKPIDPNNIIENLVYQARNRFDRLFRGRKSYITDDMTGECCSITRDVEEICHAFKIECIPFEFFNNWMNHFAALIILPNKEEYLVDCTYQQFFLLADNLPNRCIVYADIQEGPFIGNTMNKMQQESFARELIEKGYFKVVDDNLRTYINSLILTFSSCRDKDKYLHYTQEQYLEEIKRGRFLGDVRR